MDIPFVDIHTHKEEPEAGLCVKNVFPVNHSIISSKPGRCYSIGIHPWYIEGQGGLLAKQKRIVERAVSSANVIAIGEAGLDKAAEVSLEKQARVFEWQARVAEKHQKPMIIHCVKAFQEVLAVRRRLEIKTPWVFHGFQGSIELAAQIIGEGCIPSFGKGLMNNNQKALNSLKNIGPGGFFLETDEGDYSIEEVYKKASSTLGIDVMLLKEEIFKLFKRIFKLADE